MKPLHLDPDWLRQKYTDEGLSTYDIAKLVGRDSSAVYKKLIDFGIPTRPLGHNLTGADNYMQIPGVENPFAGKHHSQETKRILSEKATRPKLYLRGVLNGMFGKFGKLNPRYIDGSSPERQRAYASSEWNEIIRKVYEHDGYRCAHCGSGKKHKRGLHAHHIKTWAGNPELRFDLANIVTLCDKCHIWVHSKKNTERQYL